jgi:hypothetical protein
MAAVASWVKAHPRQLKIGGALGLALALVIGAGVYRLIDQVTNTPTGVVRSYLQALAQGNSAKALSFADSPPADTALLTDEVLAASNQRMPLTDIEVNDPDLTGTVAVTYRRGGELINTAFDTVKRASKWRIGTVAAEVDLQASYPGFSLLVNGVPASDRVVVVFPGSYQVRVDSEYLQVDGGEFLVKNGSGLKLNTSIRLSAAGVAGFREAAKVKLEACRGQRSLEAFGRRLAPYVYKPKGVKVKAETIRWELIGGAEALDRLEPTIRDASGLMAAPTRVLLRTGLQTTAGRSYDFRTGITTVYGGLAADGFKVMFE